MKKEMYVKRLLRLSKAELLGLAERIRETPNRRNAGFMLGCVMAALGTKIGMKVVVA